MSDLDSASSQLRVIRSLMERATIYRSLSAPTALAGGLLSFGGLGLAYALERSQGHPISENTFLAIWLGILVLTGAINGLVLWREAQRRGQPFFSAGMKCAMTSVFPPFLCAGFFTIFYWFYVPMPSLQAGTWIVFYGLGLLAMQQFAPRSLVVLGWAFLLSIGVACFINSRLTGADRMEDDALLASWIMALTFGLFHIIYAIAVWTLGGERTEVPETTPTESGNV
jgi:hypothetical protein